MDKIKQEETVLELDLGELALELVKRSRFVGLWALICAGVVFLGSCFVTPLYASEVLIRVDAGEDLALSRELVGSCRVVLFARETMEAVAEAADIFVDGQMLEKRIEAVCVEGTEFLRVSVRWPEPDGAKALADGVAQVLSEQVALLIPGVELQIVEVPRLPQDICWPDRPRWAALGALTGAAAAAAWVALRHIRREKLYSQ